MQVIRPSPELIAITRRWREALQRKDERTLSNLFSESESLTYVGTAKDEMWSGDVLRNGYGEHVREIPEFESEEHHVEAFECGGFGWALWTGALHFPDMEQPALLRVSLVFALEHGLWKITQFHSSIPSRNLDITGVEHRALDALVRAARKGFRQVQSEGMASVMFTDIANSSSIAEVLGDRKWARVVAVHMELVGGVIDDNGGRLVKSLGDGTMSTFVSAAAAMAAARDIQTRLAAMDDEPKLQVRIGVHTGDVVQAGDDFFGTVVNKAARIAALARPGQIKVSEATKIMVGETAGFDFTDAGMVSLKGLEGSHMVHCLGW